MGTNGLFECLFLLAQDHAKRSLKRIGSYNIPFLNKFSKSSYTFIYNPKERTFFTREFMV